MTIRTLMVALALCLAAPALALAQDDEEGGTEDGWGDDEAEGQDSSDSSETGDEGDGEPEAGGEDAEEEAEAAGEDAKDPDAEAASTGDRSWYFGAFGRYVFVPSFMLELFLEQAPTLGNGAVGVMADYRTDGGPTLQIGLGYTGYGFSGPMQAKGDPETDTEWIESDLALIHLTGSVLWSTDISEKFAFEYGVGLDLGILIGDLVRSEAFKSGADFEKCPRPVLPPDPAAAFCEPPTNLPAGTDAYDAEGAHYNVVEERVPPIGGGFMLPHLALRYQPVPEVALKLEAAYGIVQLWLGLSVAYAPDI